MCPGLGKCGPRAHILLRHQWELRMPPDSLLLILIRGVAATGLTVFFGMLHSWLIVSPGDRRGGVLQYGRWF